jgi:hypothetical protein
VRRREGVRTTVGALADAEVLHALPMVAFPAELAVERKVSSQGLVIANTAPAAITDRVRQAHAFFPHRTSDQNLTTAAPSTSPWLPDGYGQDFWPGA